MCFALCSFAGHPGDYHRIGGLRMEECPTYGCMFELTIQFITIIGGMELLNSIFHLFFQYVLNFKIHNDNIIVTINVSIVIP